MQYFRRHDNLGFTLLELLIVIAIIGILSTATVVNLRYAKAKARDAKRLADITQIKKAIDTYYGIHGTYPNPNCHSLSGLVACTSIFEGNEWISDLVDEGYFSTVPDDPFASFDDQPEDTNMASRMYLYIYTHLTNQPPAHEDYYYLYYRLETMPPRDDCNTENLIYSGGDWDQWSIICDGDLP